MRRRGGSGILPAMCVGRVSHKPMRVAVFASTAMLSLGSFGCLSGGIGEAAINSLTSGYLDAYWRMYPMRAASAGLSRFEGVAPELSRSAIDTWVRFNRHTREGLDALRRDALSEDDLVDAALVGMTIGAELLVFDELRDHRRNPMLYDISLGMLSLSRPGNGSSPARVRAMAQFLEGSTSLFEQGRRNLDPVLPRICCQVAIANLEGIAQYLRRELPGEIAATGADAEAARLVVAAARAAGAVEDFAMFLRRERLPLAVEDFAWGEAALMRMLAETEGIDLSADDLLELGEADLQRNRHRAEQLVRTHWPASTLDDAVSAMKSATYAPSALGEAIAADVERLRAFCRTYDLVSIPRDVRTIVVEAPPFARWAAAMMHAPRPFSRGEREAVYYLTTGEPGWSVGERREWSADLNRYTAMTITIHESYPGHLVQALHTNRSASPVQRALVSYAAVEGWAHYVEQMVFETGFGADEPLYELAQLLDALLRDCRLICAVRLHARGMTIDEAADFFSEHAFVEPLTARREAERGTFDPGYLKYTLGKLQFVKLREDYRRLMGDDFSLRRFHDALLSHGMPPVAVTRQRLLGADSGPSL